MKIDVRVTDSLERIVKETRRSAGALMRSLGCVFGLLLTVLCYPRLDSSSDMRELLMRVGVIRTSGCVHMLRILSLSRVTCAIEKRQHPTEPEQKMRTRLVQGSADFEMIRALHAGDHGRMHAAWKLHQMAMD